MSQYIILNRIKVQNANAVAGFTWGFPAITHFLGFTHALSRKLADTEEYRDITLSGCAVIAHEHKSHTYGPYYERRFIQSRNPPYLKSHNKTAAPPVIEEGKMNLTVSLLIGCNGNVGNREESFLQWLQNACLLQRLAGGTILDIAAVQLHTPINDRDVRNLVRKLLPGFILLDRSQYLEKHYQRLKSERYDAELLDAWLDFSMLKQKARPKSDLISKHLQELIRKDSVNQQLVELVDIWHQHLERPYEEEKVPEELKTYFAHLAENKAHKKLLSQWKNYCEPNKKTDADWEYVPKPEAGYLVPIMTGYKAISQVYKNDDVKNTRDNETDVCFVESVHSIGEWQSVHHIKSPEQLQNCLWRYHYEENWYLCKQTVDSQIGASDTPSALNKSPEEAIYS